MFSLGNWGSKPEAAEKGSNQNKLEGTLPSTSEGLPIEARQKEELHLESSSTTSDKLLTRHQILHVKSLIVNEARLSTEVKAFARYDASLLIDLVTASYADKSDAHAALLITTIHQTIKEANRESEKTGVALAAPDKFELAELRDILLEVRNAPPKLDPESKGVMQIVASFALSQLTGLTKAHAQIVYELFGPRRDIFKLVTEYPELFKEYLALYRECGKDHSDQKLQADLLALGKQIEGFKIQVPLFRELRKFEERLSEHVGKEVSNPVESAILAKLLSQYNSLQGTDKELALKIWGELGLGHKAFLAVIQAPDEFCEHLVRFGALKKAPSDQQLIHRLIESKEMLAALGIKLPNEASLEKCERLMEEVASQQLAFTIKAIQDDINENDGIDLEDTTDGEDLADDIAEIKRVLGGDPLD